MSTIGRGILVFFIRWILRNFSVFWGRGRGILVNEGRHFSVRVRHGIHSHVFRNLFPLNFEYINLVAICLGTQSPSMVDVTPWSQITLFFTILNIITGKTKWVFRGLPWTPGGGAQLLAPPHVVFVFQFPTRRFFIIYRSFQTPTYATEIDTDYTRVCAQRLPHFKLHLVKLLLHFFFFNTSFFFIINLL